MSITVCKFGGSSLSDRERFECVGKIIRGSSDRRYIVVSAPGKRSDADEKITDLLYQACEASADSRSFILSRIFHRYASIRDQLAPNFVLEADFAQICRLLPSSRDYAASRGEYLCAKLFAAYMDLPFVDAADLFFFNEKGEIDSLRTMAAISERLLPLGHAVIPGFYGTGADGNIRTFARGGSDISGAWIAAALQADLYENWTDVDGLYTADPRIVDQPLRHKTIGLHQMERLGQCGASVLHPSALTPLKGTGIDTILKNSFCPECTGTRITEEFGEILPCVTGRRGLYIYPISNIEGEYSPLLHEQPAEGAVRAAAVNVFGMQDTAIIEREIHPIHIIHMQDHMQIIIPEERYADIVRMVHHYLTR